MSKKSRRKLLREESLKTCIKIQRWPIKITTSMGSSKSFASTNCHTTNVSNASNLTLEARRIVVR